MSFTLNPLNGETVSWGGKTYVYDSTKTKWTVAGAVTTSGITTENLSTSGQITSTVPTGTAPLSISSTTLVTNLNADLLDGYSADAAATASTVVVRNASGDITARYNIGQYTSMSHAAAARTADTVFYSSTDNYIRKNTLAGFKQSLALNNVENTALSTWAGSTNLTTLGTVTAGTWSGSFGAVSGANLTSLSAGNLSGTIPNAVLGNSTLYIGTTAVALNRASAALTLSGVNISGSAGSATTATTATNLSGGSVSATTVADSAGSVRKIPAVGAKTTAYTLATTDVGKYVEVGTGGSITIPTSTFSSGDAVSIFNNTTAGITITCSALTSYISGTDAAKTSVTLATRGLCTVMFISATVCVLIGSVT